MLFELHSSAAASFKNQHVDVTLYSITSSHSLISGGSVVGGGGGQPLLASVGTSGVTGEKGTMSNMSVDCGFMEILPAWIHSRQMCVTYVS